MKRQEIIDQMKKNIRETGLERLEELQYPEIRITAGIPEDDWENAGFVSMDSIIFDTWDDIVEQDKDYSIVGFSPDPYTEEGDSYTLETDCDWTTRDQDIVDAVISYEVNRNGEITGINSVIDLETGEDYDVDYVDWELLPVPDDMPDPNKVEFALSRS